jgi:hypothetical protein
MNLKKAPGRGAGRLALEARRGTGPGPARPHFLAGAGAGAPSSPAAANL